ncbi:MAG: hypothetical protein ACI91Z_000425, partial [Yoonia sp.]
SCSAQHFVGGHVGVRTKGEFAAAAPMAGLTEPNVSSNFDGL